MSPDPKPNTHNGDLANPPLALRALCEQDRWVGWKWILGKKGKWTKPPYQVNQPGILAANNDPRTWGGYHRAVEAVRAGRLDGIGFALTDTEIGAVDLDNCRDPETGEIDAWAQEKLALAPDAYHEVTVSGTGLRIIGTATGAAAHRKFAIPGAREGAAVEIYRKATRYITVSAGEIGHCSQLPNIDAVIDSILAEYGGQPKSNGSSKERVNGHAGNPGCDIEDIIKNGAPEPTRSQMFARVIWSLAGQGLAVEEIEARLRRYPNGIAEKYWPRLRAEVERCYSKWRLAQDQADDRDLADINSKFALVTVGGNVRIMTMTADPTFYRPGDFKLLLQNRDKFINKKPVPIAAWWLGHPQRRQYSGVVFEPGEPENFRGCRNLWAGFAFEPKPGDCNLYLALLYEVICNGDEAHYNYLLDLMADTVQHPNKQGDVAPVFRGPEGVGKGFATRKFGALFGRHFLHITQASQLVGKFNAHLAQCSVLFADEAFFAGDRQHEATLKALITEPTFMVERKGMDAVAAQNRVHLWLSSNEDWVVPAGSTARRFFCLDVPDTHRNDVKYFAAIDEQMRNGGYSALLHNLQNRELSDTNIREVPQTAALAEQKALTRRGVDALVEWVASEGALPCAGATGDVAITSGPDLKEGFYDLARKRVPGLQYLTPTTITRTLKKEWKCASWHGGSQRGIRLTLKELRHICETRFGRLDWPNDEDKWG